MAAGGPGSERCVSLADVTALAAETCVSRVTFGTSVDMMDAARIPGYQDVRTAASPAPVFFCAACPMGHICSARNWCELLKLP